MLLDDFIGEPTGFLWLVSDRSLPGGSPNKNRQVEGQVEGQVCVLLDVLPDVKHDDFYLETPLKGHEVLKGRSHYHPVLGIPHSC